MAAIVYQSNKKTGVRYAYESVSYWDKEKQQSRSKRRCIGRVDPATQSIVATRKRKGAVIEKEKKGGHVPTPVARRTFYGATYLLDRLGEEMGVAADLKHCFPDTYTQILSLAYYLILEDRNPLSRFPHWAALHHHPHGEVIPSQRSSELFASISEDARHRFFKLQGKRRIDKEYLAYDSTSISSYSQSLRQVRYGKNKDGEALPQLNLAVLFGQQSRLPFYYRKLAGNIPDVSTLRKLLADMATLGGGKIKVVLDRGFFSASNLNALYKHRLKFLIAGHTSLKWVKTHLNTVRDTMRHWTHYSIEHQLYAYTLPIRWPYAQDRPYKKDTLQEERRLYLHVYFSPDQALEDEKAFNSRLLAWQDELGSGQRNPDHEKHYATYFEVKTTPVRGTKVMAKEEALAEAKRYYGYFVLMSNDVKEAIPALAIYRNKDVVEKAFENLKDRLNLNRVAVSSEKSLDGKLFVQFVALTYLSCLTKKMQDAKLFKTHTLQEVLDALDVIECFQTPGKSLQIGEIMQPQIDLYSHLGVPSPSSLH